MYHIIGDTENRTSSLGRILAWSLWLPSVKISKKLKWENLDNVLNKSISKCQGHKRQWKTKERLQIGVTAIKLNVKSYIQSRNRERHWRKDWLDSKMCDIQVRGSVLRFISWKWYCSLITGYHWRTEVKECVGVLCSIFIHLCKLKVI